MARVTLVGFGFWCVGGTARQNYQSFFFGALRTSAATGEGNGFEMNSLGELWAVREPPKRRHHNMW
jgi:hypothetical protein